MAGADRTSMAGFPSGQPAAGPAGSHPAPDADRAIGSPEKIGHRQW